MFAMTLPRTLVGLQLVVCLAPAQSERFDVVIAGGRVVDPESGLDAVRNVGIRGGIVAVITEKPLAGREVVDASGLVVAPGFIDLHSHAQTLAGHRMQAFDGDSRSS
jgi:N-acyl-D-glutamate deacylase